MKIRKINLVIGVILLSISVPSIHAKTVQARSVSYADVSAAVSEATYGDTVTIPAGKATWARQLLITKYLTIRGAGIGETIITGSWRSPYSEGDASGFDADDTTTALILYQPDFTSRSADGLFRVTGITFDGNKHRHGGISLKNFDNTDWKFIRNIRIDNNRFQECYPSGVHFFGLIHGLIDHSEFYDGFRDIRVQGNFWRSWMEGEYWLGDENAVYIEDSSFEWSGNMASYSHFIDNQWGARYVFRYCTLKNPPVYDIFDIHGNYTPVTNSYAPRSSTSGGVAGHGYERGGVSVEIYENTITNFGTNPATSVYRILEHRDGTAIVFNNRITGPQSSGALEMRERDGPSENNYVSGYPGYDRIKDSFYFNNTLNGKEIVPSKRNASDSYMIVEDRQYWRKKSAVNGIQSSGVGVGPLTNRPSSGKIVYSNWNQIRALDGSITTNPDRSGDYAPKGGGTGYWSTDTRTLFRWDGVTWKTFYKPYTYPHPLSTIMDGSPNPPKPPYNLHVIY